MDEFGCTPKRSCDNTFVTSKKGSQKLLERKYPQQEGALQWIVKGKSVLRREGVFRKGLLEGDTSAWREGPSRVVP